MISCQLRWCGKITGPQGPKQIWVVPHAGHAKAYATSPAAYRAHLQAFLARYVK